MGGKFCSSVTKENNKETDPLKFAEGVEGKVSKSLKLSYSLAIKGNPKGGTLEQIKAFMDAHPEEIVFIELVHEYGRKLNDAQREWIYRRTI